MKEGRLNIDLLQQKQTEKEQQIAEEVLPRTSARNGFLGGIPDWLRAYRRPLGNNFPESALPVHWPDWRRRILD